MTVLLVILLTLLALVIGWYIMEARWDRRLFAAHLGGGIAQNVHPEAAAVLLRENPEMQVLDVRSAREFAGGALPRAVNISLGDPAFRDRLRELDPQRPVLVYCAGGYRSRKAVPLLQEAGFLTIHHLHRGFLAWRIKGQTVVPIRN
jgi:rhodanese-related sulfurtransferase